MSGWLYFILGDFDLNAGAAPPFDVNVVAGVPCAPGGGVADSFCDIRGERDLKLDETARGVACVADVADTPDAKYDPGPALLASRTLFDLAALDLNTADDVFFRLGTVCEMLGEYRVGSTPYFESFNPRGSFEQKEELPKGLPRRTLEGTGVS